jgi:hypothetical protein
MYRFTDSLLGGTALAKPSFSKITRRAYTRDGLNTFDQSTVDSSGVFLIGELERLDQTLNMPLVSYQWRRDIDLREDVTIADEVASFTNSTFAAIGGINPNGKAWAGKDANAIASVALDIGKTPNPLNLWAMELGWTLPELESAARLGRPVDTQKFEGMSLKLEMDIDEQVYIGDSILPSCYGLFNSPSVTATNVANGATGSPLWTSKTPAEILNDINTALNAAWAASGWAQAPTDLRLPPANFGYITTQTVAIGGTGAAISVLEYIRQNCISTQINGRPINIQPSKWLIGRGTGGTSRMMTYTKDPKYVRFPMVPLQRTPIEYRSLYQLTTYFGRLGQVEFRYPETLGYSDGI